MNYLQIVFETGNTEQSEIVLALLSDSGFSGFEDDNNSLKAFIAQHLFIQEELDTILKIIDVNYSITVIPEENWNAQWERSFEPIVVNNFVAIRAGFHQPVKNVQHEIIITPKMSFGTGHHPTTYMVIEQMEGLDINGKTMLDFGTGTGVLAILSEKMGAAKVLAIDNDDWSIANAKENITANGCTKIELLKAQTMVTGSTYDIIIANINLNVILPVISIIAAISNKEAVVLLSGFLKADEDIVMNTIISNGFKNLFTSQKADWICMKIIKA